MMLLPDLRLKPAGLLTYQPMLLPLPAGSVPYDTFVTEMLNVMASAMGIPAELLTRPYPNRVQRRKDAKLGVSR